MTEGRESVAVAVRSKQLLATSFHPELTEELRWCVHLIPSRTVQWYFSVNAY